MTDGRRTAVKVVAIIAVIIIVVLLLLNPGVQSLLKSIFVDPFQSSYPEYATFTLRRTFTIDANGGTVYNYTIDIPLPSDLSENGNPLQEVQSVSEQPNPSVEERYGMEWMEWGGTGPVGQNSLSISITYQMRVSTYIWNLESGTVGNISDIPDSLKDAYLGDEWRIIVDHPSIHQRSQAIVGERTNVEDALRSIYDWIVDNVDYPSSSTLLPKTSLETLSSGVGDCDDQAVLFCALARAAGIPAWLQIGVLYDPFWQEWGGHAWVQAYLPLKDGEGVNATIDTVNRDFLLWRPNRFADFTDDGDAAHLEDYYLSFHCSYDPTSYPEGETPIFGQEFVALEYQESDSTVRPEDFNMASALFFHRLISPDICRVQVRI